MDYLSLKNLCMIAGTILVLVGLGACGGSNSPAPTERVSAGDPVSNPPGGGQTEQSITFTVAGDGARQVPANGSTGTITADLKLAESTGAITGSLALKGVTPTAAHIHRGFAGTNGSVVVALEVAGDTLSLPAGTVLNAAQIAAMKSGEYYLNVHSASYPDGELRGQILMPGVTVFFANLSGAQVAPPIDNDAVGRGYVTLNENDSLVTAFISVINANTATDAHIHAGAPGISGPIVLPLMRSPSDPGFWSAEQVSVSPFALEVIKGGETYFNVHLPIVDGRETRGQILPQ